MGFIEIGVKLMRNCENLHYYIAAVSRKENKIPV